ncbi:hypothetical protein [Spirosoma litoris]
MAKTYTEITEAGTFKVASKATATIVNTGSTSVFVVNNDDTTSLQGLPERVQEIVLKALHCIEPGKSLKVSSGNYRLTFEMPMNCSAVVVA